MRAFLLLSLTAVLSAALQSPAGEATLSRVIDVLALPRAEGAAKPAIHLEGTILYYKPGKFPDIFLRDSSSEDAVYVGTRNYASELTLPPLRPGQRISVDGIFATREFAPAVEATQIVILGEAALPTAKPTPLAGISTLRDGEYVTLSGIVRHATVDSALDPPRLLVDLATPGGSIRLWILHYPAALPSLVDGEITATGLVHYFRNGRMQPLGARLLVSDVNDIRLTAPAPTDPFALPVALLAEIETYARRAVSQHRVHVTGVVTRLTGNTLFLASGLGGLRVSMDEPASVQVGDTVDVVGFAVMGNLYGQIENAICRVRAHGAGSPPVSHPKAMALNAAEFDGGLVELEGVARDRWRAKDLQVVLVQRGNALFEATLRTDDQRELFQNVPLGSVVSVTGIWESMGVLREEPAGQGSFRLLLRSPLDVIVRQRGPLWTVERLGLAVGVLVTALAAGAAWMAYLRRRNLALESRVEERGAQLGREIHARREAEVKFAAITAERNRLARDLHDTVEQILTGAGVQLSLLGELLPPDNAKAAQKAAFIREILREAQAEARRSVWDLQPHLLQEHDLSDALREMALQLTEGSNADFTITLEGAPRSLAMAEEGQLLRIGQEAITNAVKHAAATCIRVEIDFRTAEAVTLRISDNGRGFDPQRVESISTGHFGLNGIRERARRLGATCEILSNEGRGAQVIVTLPLRANQAPVEV